RRSELFSPVSSIVRGKVEGYLEETLTYSGNLSFRRYSSNTDFSTVSGVTQQDLGDYDAVTTTAANTNVIYLRTGNTYQSGQQYVCVFKMTDGSGGIGLGYVRSDGTYRGLLLASASGNLYYTSPFIVSVQRSGILTYGVGDIIRMVIDGSICSLWKNGVKAGDFAIDEPLTGEISIAIRGQLSVDFWKISQAEEFGPIIPSFEKIEEIEESLKNQVKIFQYPVYRLPNNPSSLKVLAIGNSFS